MNLNPVLPTPRHQIRHLIKLLAVQILLCGLVNAIGLKLAAAYPEDAVTGWMLLIIAALAALYGLLPNALDVYGLIKYRRYWGNAVRRRLVWPLVIAYAAVSGLIVGLFWCGTSQSPANLIAAGWSSAVLVVAAAFPVGQDQTRMKTTVFYLLGFLTFGAAGITLSVLFPATAALNAGLAIAAILFFTGATDHLRR